MPLRDLLMHLAEAKVFRPRWTDAIHDEWTRNVRKRNPGTSAEYLALLRTCMNVNNSGGLVSGYEHRITSIALPDPNDRHVVAAAAHANARVIVTFNLRDFPEESLMRWKLKAQHPDVFIAELLEKNPQGVIAAIAAHRRSLSRPPLSVDEYLDMLVRQGLTNTVEKLRQLKAAI